MAKLPPLVDDIDKNNILFLVTLIEYSLSMSTRGPKNVKNPKTKELKFEASETIQSFIAFLTAILLKFGEKSDFISEKNTYPFKYFHPPTKKADAISVESHEEYIKMIQALLSQRPNKINIILDMTDIKSCQ